MAMDREAITIDLDLVRFTVQINYFKIFNNYFLRKIAISIGNYPEDIIRKSKEALEKKEITYVSYFKV